MTMLCFVVFLFFLFSPNWGYLEAEKDYNNEVEVDDMPRSKYSRFEHKSTNGYERYEYPSDYYFRSKALDTWKHPVYRLGQYPGQRPGGNMGRLLPTPKFPYIS